MRQYAVSMGVPVEDIVLDYAGRRTYDTCYRDRAIFGVERAMLVTQKFHLPQALFLCNSLGVDALVVEDKNWNYRRVSLLIWNFREQLATVVAFFDLYVDKPTLVLGLPELIFGEYRTYIVLKGDYMWGFNPYKNDCLNKAPVDNSRLSVDKWRSLWKTPHPVRFFV
jgi:vancomycin permeability regulator SanA